MFSWILFWHAHSSGEHTFQRAEYCRHVVKERGKEERREISLAPLVKKGRVTKTGYGKAKIFSRAHGKVKIPDPYDVTRLNEELQSMVAEVSDLAERNYIVQPTVNILRSQYILRRAKVQDTKLIDALPKQKGGTGNAIERSDSPRAFEGG